MNTFVRQTKGSKSDTHRERLYAVEQHSKIENDTEASVFLHFLFII